MRSVHLPQRLLTESSFLHRAVCILRCRPASLIERRDVSRECRSVADGILFIADEGAVAEGIGTERMREGGGSIHRGVGDIVRQLSADERRVQSRQSAYPLGDLMVGTGCVAADAQPADDFAVFVERNPAAEGDDPADRLPDAAIGTEGVGIKGLGLVETPERMAGL